MLARNALIRAVAGRRQGQLTAQPVRPGKQDGAERHVRARRAIRCAELDVELPCSRGGISRGEYRADAQRRASVLLHDVDRSGRPAIGRKP